jgi:hypothetical protein
MTTNHKPPFNQNKTKPLTGDALRARLILQRVRDLARKRGEELPKSKILRTNGIRNGTVESIELQDAFLEAFEKVATIVGAANVAGVERRTHYRWMTSDPVYAQRFARAEEAATQRLEQEARRRAMVGVEEPIYYRGKVCGSVKKYSDVLLIFLLKARRPSVYRERFDQTINIRDDSDLSALSSAELIARIDTLRETLREADAIERAIPATFDTADTEDIDEHV